jgi:hypothetical protein
MKKGIWYLYSGTISNFFPLPIMEMKPVMPSQYFSGNKPMATEMRRGRIKN